MTRQQAAPRHTNRLISETSPYLLQHAHNPVAWFPWGEEALRRAQEENRPILLSISYSSCHGATSWSASPSKTRAANGSWKPESVPADIRAEEISLVGRYAIWVHWSDGHSTGIYPFDKLRAACACETCRRGGVR